MAVPFEVKEAARAALSRGAVPLPSHARRADALRLEQLIGRARACDVEPELIERSEQQLGSWWTQVERHEALDVLNQAFFRMDSDGDGYVDRKANDHSLYIGIYSDNRYTYTHR